MLLCLNTPAIANTFSRYQVRIGPLEIFSRLPWICLKAGVWLSSNGYKPVRMLRLSGGIRIDDLERLAAWPVALCALNNLWIT